MILTKQGEGEGLPLCTCVQLGLSAARQHHHSESMARFGGFASKASQFKIWSNLQFFALHGRHDMPLSVDVGL